MSNMMPLRILCRNPFVTKSNIFPKSVTIRNYWRRNVFDEISSAMQRNVKEMDDEINRLFGGFQRSSPLKIPRIFSALDWNKREIPVITTNDDGQSYRLEVYLEGMNPEDINITLKDNELTIKAHKEEKGSDGSRYVRENLHTYTLPKEVNPETIVSKFSRGILIIEAPLPALQSKEIPIKIESSSSSSSDSETKK